MWITRPMGFSVPFLISTFSMASAETEWIVMLPDSNATRPRPLVMSVESAMQTSAASIVSGFGTP